MGDRNFNSWLNMFKESICDYKYYTNFENVYKNSETFKVELHILNSLIGSGNIEDEFKHLINNYPSVLKVIPILLAKRESEIYCNDEKGSYWYNFNKFNRSINVWLWKSFEIQKWKAAVTRRTSISQTQTKMRTTIRTVLQNLMQLWSGYWMANILFLI